MIDDNALDTIRSLTLNDPPRYLGKGLIKSIAITVQHNTITGTIETYWGILPIKTGKLFSIGEKQVALLVVYLGNFYVAVVVEDRDLRARIYGLFATREDAIDAVGMSNAI